MNALFALCPQPPALQVDWSVLDERFPWVRNLAGCPQDPVYHAEGDVWIHTRMVCEALAGIPAWRSLPEQERQTLFAAPPSCTTSPSRPAPAGTRTAASRPGATRGAGASLRGSSSGGSACRLPSASRSRQWSGIIRFPTTWWTGRMPGGLPLR
jgi:hypothetical protein